MRLFAALVWVLAFPFSRCRADVYLNAGDSVTASFSTMFIPSVPTADWVVQHGSELLYAGSKYRISFYEDSILDPPIEQFVVSGSSPTGSSGFIIDGYDNKGFWQDQQGAVRIDMLSGSVSIQDVAVETQIGGQKYLQFMFSFSNVPEPSVLGLGGLTLPIFLRRRPKA